MFVLNTERRDDIHLMVKSRNELVNSRLHLSQSELDFLFYLLSMVKEGTLSYSFRISDLSGLSGKKLNSSQVLSTTKSLVSRHVLLFQDSEQWEVVNLFESIGYDKGLVTVRLTPRASLLFSETKSRYTLFELHSALSLNGKYSKRLYWLLSMWRSKGSKSYTPDELRDLLSVREYDTRNVCISDAYPQNGQFKRRCDEWCREISRSTDLDVSSEWVKNGKNYVSVIFTIKVLKRADSLAAFSDEEEKTKALKVFLSYGLTDKQAERLWVEGCTLDKFSIIVHKAEESIRKTGNQVWNPAAYLITCLEAEGYQLNERIDLEEMEQVRRRKAFEVERNAQLQALRTAASLGVDVSYMHETMIKYGISRDEILSD